MASSGPEQLRRLHRILITTDAVGGVWQYAVDLTRWLCDTGVEVLVATMGPLPSAQQLAQLPTSVRVEVSQYALEWSRYPWTEVDEAGRWLLSLADVFQPDLVHLNGYVHAALPWTCPTVVVGHSCVASWWRAVHQRDCGPEWKEYCQRVGAGLKASTRVVTPSRFMAQQLQVIYGLAESKTSIVHNFSSTPQHPQTKQPFCFSAGRVWDEAKNFTLLRTVAESIQWPVRLAGDFDSRALERQSFAPLQMVGKLDRGEILRQMHAAQLFLHPALYEPFGLAVLEAARCGCGLVLADIPTMRELWQGAAIFVDARDPVAWAKTVQLLTENVEACDEWGNRAKARAARYSEEKFRLQYAALYTKVLEQPRKHGAAA